MSQQARSPERPLAANPLDPASVAAALDRELGR